MESNMHACFEIAGFYPHTFYAIPIYHSENFVIVFDKINKHILDNFMITYFTKRLKMKMFLILILQGVPHLCGSHYHKFWIMYAQVEDFPVSRSHYHEFCVT